MSNVDLSWMNVPGSDGLTFIEKYERGLIPSETAADLSWMNVRGADGLTFIERINLNKSPSPVSTPPKTLTLDANNAYNQLKRYLTDFKLDSLVEPLWNYMIDTGVQSDDQLWLWIQDRPEFHTRFPAFKKLQEEGRAISPVAYIELEKNYAQIMRASNIPNQFFDNADDFTDLIIGNVSPAEFQSRIEKGYKRVAEAGSLVRDAFKSYFGVEGDAALAAFFIDPDRSAPALERAVQSAEIQAAALSANNSVNLSYASKLADMGVTYDQAMQGFQRLNAMKSLFSSSVGEAAVDSSTVNPSTLTSDLIVQGDNELRTAVVREGETPSTRVNISDDSSTMNQESQLGTDFVFGTNAQTQRELQLRLEQRKAESSGSTQQSVINKRGRTSLGTSSS